MDRPCKHDKMVFWTFIFGILALLSPFANCNTSGGSYSINFVRKSGSTGSITFNYAILVNGVVQASGSPTIASDAESGWINFEATLGDTIYVEVEGINSADSFTMFYLINNAADGNGIQIYTSQSTTFFPVNNCQSSVSCTFFIAKSPSTSWAPNSLATIYINNEASVFFNGNDPATVLFTAKANDILRVEFTFDNSDGNPDIGYALTLNPQAGPFNHWYYNSFGFNSTIPTGPGPTGGLLLPINSELTSAFAVSLSPGPSTPWISDS